ATPYVQDYDMVVGAFVVVWLAEAAALERSPHGARRNAGTPLPDFAALHPGYKLAAALILAVPIVAAPFAKLTGLALGCLFLVPAFVMMARPLAAKTGLAGAAAPR